MKYNIVLLFLLYLLISLLANCVSSLEAESIIAGDPAKLGQFKYQASLAVGRDNKCGGGIIDDTHVITAAHCVIDRNEKFRPDVIQVITGTVDLDDTKAVTIQVEKIYVLKEFQYANAMVINNTNSDIAVLKLKSGLGLGKNANLDQLALPDGTSTYANDIAVIAGFGHTWFTMGRDSYNQPAITGGGSDRKLHYVNADVYSNLACGLDYRTIVHEANICARSHQRIGYRNAGICTGDSGGPLVFNNIIIGVVNSGGGCNEKYYPAVYTRVSYYKEFVNDALKDNRTPMMRVAAYKKEKSFFGLFTKEYMNEI